MARPKTPLIEREVALDTALRIIGDHGIDAFSIRRLADEIGVNGASLYHHFANKEAILVEATERALSRTPMVIREVRSDDWRPMLLSGVTQLLDLLLAQPGLFPIIVRRRSMGMGTRMLDVVAGRLLEADVPAGAIAPMFDALERLAIGWADREIQGESSVRTLQAVDTPHLDRALAAVELDNATVFEVCALSIMDGIVAAHRDRASAPRAATRKATKAPAKKTVVKKTVAKKAPAKKAPVKKTVAKKAPAKKAPAKKTVAKRAAAT